jgi:hypothetical protein
MPLNLADEIRRFVYQHYVVAGRNRGRSDVEVRAGDVHHDMQLVGRMPAVCSALGAKFEMEYGVKLLDRRGPRQGSNVFFRFRVDSGTAEPHLELRPSVPTMGPEPPGQDRQGERQTPPTARTPGCTVILVSCVKTKRASAVQARGLYISDWFLKVRRYVEQSGAPWFILSAEHGLVPPDEVISPYERTLNTMPVADRRHWAGRVITQLSERLPEADHVIFLAGARYREFLVEPLRRKGITVAIPMEGLARGPQLRWLAQA